MRSLPRFHPRAPYTQDASLLHTHLHASAHSLQRAVLHATHDERLNGVAALLDACVPLELRERALCEAKVAEQVRALDNERVLATAQRVLLPVRYCLQELLLEQRCSGKCVVRKSAASVRNVRAPALVKARAKAFEQGRESHRAAPRCVRRPTRFD